MNKQDSQKINRILKIMKPADEAYWNHSTNNIISDGEYDTLYMQLKQLKKKYPQDKRIKKYFSTMHVDRDNTFTRIKHPYHVISLDKTRTKPEISHFFDKWNLNKGSLWYTDGFTVERKNDGLSIVMYFNDPRMPHKKLTVLTRGSGVKGNDITNEAYYYLHMDINKIMKRIGNRHVVVRGEALINHKDFEKDRKVTPFKNERNLVSGSVMNKDPKTVKDRRVFLSAYTLLNRDEYTQTLPTELQQMRFLNKLGFYTIQGIHYFPNTKAGKQDALKYILNFSHEQRKSVGYDIDGLVIKPNYTANFDKIGWNKHGPRYSISYKFPPEQALARIKTVRWQESAMGKLTPVLIFNHPVHIFGAYITKATGASIPTMKKYNIAINGFVTIKRMNDVIPKAFGIPALNKSADDLKSPLTTLPHGAFRKGPFYYLHVNANSMPAILNRWKKFVSKPCLNVMGLSDKMIKTMIQYKLINPHDFSSLWQINRKKFIQTPSFAKKGWDNLQQQLKQAQHTPLAQVMLGLPINNAGLSIFDPVSKRIGNFTPLLFNKDKRNSVHQKLLKEIPNIKGLGDASKPVINDLFSPRIIKQLQSLSRYLDLKDNQPSHKPQNNKLNNMNFVITGSLSKPRKYFKQTIQNNGGNLKGTVSGTTNYLICNQPSNSSKYRKAVAKHVKIINEQQFKKLLNK